MEETVDPRDRRKVRSGLGCFGFPFYLMILGCLLGLFVVQFLERDPSTEQLRVGTPRVADGSPYCFFSFERARQRIHSPMHAAPS